jgi:coproporphyrinogen III oxidase
MDKDTIKSSFKSIQENICDQFEALDRSSFTNDEWTRPEGGGGVSKIMQGRVIEKGGVNFSAVEGNLPESMSKMMGLESCSFFASGVSIVMHPINPWVPIIHMNIRYFETSTGKWWFGGGIDLTPHYVNVDEARFFHTELKEVCDKHHPDYYGKFKKWADDYFYIEHRKETRGIGGIFFDYLNENEPLSKEELFRFVCDVGNSFAPIYWKLVQDNKFIPFSKDNLKWQQMRRGRYVEFNLIYDRGTKFGLQTDGRIESILMSLPSLARWEYDFKTKPGSLEDKTLKSLVKNYNWID